MDAETLEEPHSREAQNAPLAPTLDKRFPEDKRQGHAKGLRWDALSGKQLAVPSRAASPTRVLSYAAFEGLDATAPCVVVPTSGTAQSERTARCAEVALLS